MRPDSQQSLDRSRSAGHMVRGAVAAFALTGAVAVDSYMTSPSSTERPSDTEVSVMDQSFLKNVLRFDGKKGFANALWSCWLKVSGSIQAPQGQSPDSVVGAQVELWNKYNPVDVKTLEAKSPLGFREGKPNAVFVGSGIAEADVYGNNDPKCGRDEDCDKTTLVFKEKNGSGKTVESHPICDKNGEVPCYYSFVWTSERPLDISPTLQPTVEVTPTATLQPTPTPPACVNVGQALERCD